MDALCVDKTGTITMNQLAVTGVIPLDHSTESDVLFDGALASQEANQDPIDLAFLAAVRERHIFDTVPAVTAVFFKPFDPQSRQTILKATFVAIAFVVTGKFVVSAFAMLLLVFMTDFAKIALATDHVRSSRKSETWNIGGFITVSMVLGVAILAEALLLLYIGRSRFGLATNDNALYTFSFLTLLYLAVFSIVSARERPWFWATMPSKTLVAALTLDALVGTGLTLVGPPGPNAIALMADAHGICLYHGCVPRGERCREGCDDQVARSYGSG
jgi:hypothetical protein